MTRDQGVEGIHLGRILAGEVHPDVVYFLAMPYGSGRAVKIGTSTRLLARVTNVSYAATLTDVLLLLPGGREAETALHDKFRDYQIDGYRELFWLKGRLRDFLDWSPPQRPLSVWSRRLSVWPRRRQSPVPAPKSEPSPRLEVRPEEISNIPADPRGLPVSLAEAVGHGYVPGATVQALRMDRHRSDKGELPEGLKFPEPIAEVGSGRQERFWSSEIEAFNARRRRARVA